MQFIFYLIATIILVFLSLSTLIGIFAGGTSFFYSFKRGVKFLLISFLVLIIIGGIYTFISSLKFNPVNPLVAIENTYTQLKSDGIDLLSAKPYYFGLVCLGIAMLISGLFRWSLFSLNNREDIQNSFSIFILAFLIYAFSNEGQYFKNFAKYTIALMLVCGTFLNWIMFIGYLIKPKKILVTIQRFLDKQVIQP